MIPRSARPERQRPTLAGVLIGLGDLLADELGQALADETDTLLAAGHPATARLLADERRQLLADESDTALLAL
jgi:hypothetical protein